MLKSVRKPDGSVVSFEYDALGRRISKTVGEKVSRFLWDGNVLLHEWEYQKEDRPRTIINDLGEIYLSNKETVNNLITWVYDNNNYNPSAKIVEDETYSIINDYLGTPIQVYNTNGKLIWERELDIYGKIRKLDGDKNLIPFLYQGQIWDEDIELAYNRFRYYSSDMGVYISQDPIRLKGNNPNIYAFVSDNNCWIDIFGLDILSGIQSQVNSILMEHLPAIQAIDPNATIGYRGSVASGISKAYDINLTKPFNPNNFDVDAFIKSDYLATLYDNRRRDAGELPGFSEIQESIDKKLREAFPGLKDEPFGFRIFKTHELDELSRKGDIQVHLSCH